VVRALVVVEALASQANAQGVTSVPSRASADRPWVPSSISSHVTLGVLAAGVRLTKVARVRGRQRASSTHTSASDGLAGTCVRGPPASASSSSPRFPLCPWRAGALSQVVDLGGLEVQLEQEMMVEEVNNDTGSKH